MHIYFIKTGNDNNSFGILECVCDTQADTAAKTLNTENNNFGINSAALIAGLQIRVKFTNGNTAANPTLLTHNIVASGYLQPSMFDGQGDTMDLVYDGTNWVITGGIYGGTPVPPPVLGNTVTLVATNTSGGFIDVYDGQNGGGTLLAHISDDGSTDVICTTGYLFAFYGSDGYGISIGTPSTGITVAATDNYSYATFQVTQDGSINGMRPNACYIKGTKITLADGTYKNVEDITYEDDLLVWDFDKGQFASAKPLWLQKSLSTIKYNHLLFSDGSELNTVNQHRIFNKEAGKFTYPMTDDTPIGTTTFNDKGEFITLVSKEVIEEEAEYYNIITDYHINCFAGTILTSCRMSNLYPIVDMKYIKEERKAIQYNVPEKWYNGLRLAEQPEWIVTSNNAYDFGDKSYEDYVNRLIENAR